MSAEELRRRIRIRAPPGVTVNFGSRGVDIRAARGPFGGRIPIATRGRGPQVGPRANGQRPEPNLPRLQPQVLPEDKQELKPKNEKDNDDEDHSSFKCSICYDMMRDPVGCGKCSARFCHGCLKRVVELSALQQQQQPSGNPENNNQNSPRCPVCRSPMDDPDDIQRDAALRQLMEEAPPIACRYAGCEEQLQIPHVAHHEHNCPHVRVQCRFQPFGCPWAGKRADLAKHDQEDCHLARVSQLVERQRYLQVEMAQLAHSMAHLHQSLLANASIMELQRSRDNHSLSTANFFQIFHYVHVLTCCTPRFLVTKEGWTTFHGDQKGQAAVANLVTLTPTNMLILKTLAASYHHLLIAAKTIETEEQLLDFLDCLLYFLFLILLAIVLAVCFLGEDSPEKWKPLHLALPQTRFTNPEMGCDSHILLYSVIFGMAASHAFALEISGNALRATFLWVYLCVSSTIFPAMVTRMSTSVNVAVPPNAPPSNPEVIYMIHMGRAARPLWLGLCYAPCTVVFGIMPSIDAAVGIFLSQDVLKKMIPVYLLPNGDIIAQPGGLLSQIPTAALYIYSGARLAMRASDFPQEGWKTSLDFLFVALFVVATKYLLWQIFKCGMYFGMHILNQSRQSINPTAISVLRTEYHGMGVSLFCFWCLLVGAIAIT